MARIVRLKPTGTGKPYEVQWSWYDSAEHRRFKRARFRTLEEAKAKKREVEDALSCGYVPNFEAPKRLVRDYGEEWLSLKAASLKPSTLASYRAIWDASVCPWFGGMRVSRVTHVEVERYIAHLQRPKADGKPRSHLTIRHHVWLLRQVLNRAVKADGLPHNPVDRAENMPTARSTGRKPYRPQFLTEEDVATLAAALDQRWPDAPWGLLVQFTAWTGLRAGEVAGLNVGDVDLLHRTVKVERTRQKRTRKSVEHTPKNGEPRIIPLMPTWLVDDLQKYLAGHPRPNGEDSPLWPGTRSGGPASRRLDWTVPWDHGTFYRHRYRPAVLAVGPKFSKGVDAKKVNFHSLRHTFASLAAARDIPSAQVAAWMGHANDIITRQVYTHLFDTSSQRWAAQMGAGERPQPRRDDVGADVVRLHDVG